jgi:phosphatidylglycerol:prolipoprotein diacylglycerol transferase
MIAPQFDPVALQLGPLAIRWYGLMYLLGFGVAWALGRWRARQQPQLGYGPADVDDVLFYGMLGVVLGGRMGYVLFYNFGAFLQQPWMLFKLWEGGMSFHGGLLGVIAAMAWYAHRHQRALFDVTDFIAPLIPPGLFFGRIGNFINGELWGAPGAVPWALQAPCWRQGVYDRGLCQVQLDLPAGSALTPPLHPSQLYEAALEGAVLFALLWWFAARSRPRMAVSGLFLLGYGLFRGLIEFVRMPDAHIGHLAFGWLTMGHLLTLPMILLGMGLLTVAYRRQETA